MLGYSSTYIAFVRGSRSPYLYLLFASFLFVMTATTQINNAQAKTISVSPEDNLQHIIDRAAQGDVIKLKSGVYSGNIKISKPLSLTSIEPHKAIVHGGNTGSTITVTAPNVNIIGLSIRNSGISVTDENAGIYMAKTATGGVIENNRLTGNLFGISLHGSSSVRVSDNFIDGSQNRQWSERGDGIRMWNVNDSIIENNEFQHGRDGIFITTSSGNILRNNIMHDLRFAIHYMYAHGNEVSGNRSYNNKIGYALMYSNKLNVYNNISLNDRDHGIMFNFAHRSIVKNNAVKGKKGADGKCTFLYNATKNIIKDNYFEGCAIGIHYTAGSKDNKITGNIFINNRHQVKYVGTRYQEWSENGSGNYWSDNTSFDLDGDGISDAIYKPNSMADQIIWTVPSARLLLASPIMKLLEWTQRQFPMIYPGGITDSFALIHYQKPLELEALEKALSL